MSQRLQPDQGKYYVTASLEQRNVTYPSQQDKFPQLNKYIYVTTCEIELIVQTLSQVNYNFNFQQKKYICGYLSNRAHCQINYNKLHDDVFIRKNHFILKEKHENRGNK